MTDRSPFTTPAPLPPLLRDAFDTLSEGVAVFDARLELVYCNRPFRTLRDYPDSICRPGAPISALYTFNAERGDYGDVDPGAEVAVRVERARKRTAEELDQQLADGTILHVRYAPVAHGALLFTYEDVTEKRRTEAALRASEQRNLLVAETTTEGIYEWHPLSNEFITSQRLDELFGFEAGGVQANAWKWNERIHPEDFAGYRHSLIACLKNDRARHECEYRIRAGNGDYIWVLDRGVVAERNADGKAVRFIGAILGIDDRKQAEEALKESELRHALAVDAMNEGIYDWDITGDSIYYSGNVRKVLGFSASELTNPGDWVEHIHPEDRQDYRDRLVAHFKGQSERFEWEGRYRRNDDHWYWARTHGIAIRDDNGRAIRMIGSTGDITEQKAITAELETLRTRLFDAVEAIASGFALFDAEDRLVLCNSVYRRYFAEVTDQVVAGTRFMDFIQAAVREGLFPEAEGHEQEFLETVRTRRGHTEGYREQHLRGDLWLQISDHRMSDGGLVSIYTDISELKQREAQLAEQTRILEATLENMGQGISMVDNDLNVVAFNSKFLEMLDFPAGQFRPGFPMAQAFRYNAERGEYGEGNIEEMVRERLELSRQFKPHHFERTLADGTVIEMVGHPIRSGGFVTTYTDVTERTRTQNALRENEERYALAMEGANEGLWDWDVNSGDIYVSARLRELIGIRHQNNRVSAEEWQSGILAEDVDLFRTTIRAHLRGETPYYSCEYRTRGVDGAIRWVLHRGVGLRGEDGRVYRMAGSMGDISGLKQREQELRSARDAAEQALANLKIAQRSLLQAEKMASLGQLTAGIAHEIKNPLHFINNFSKTSIELLRELAELLAPQLSALEQAAHEDAEDLFSTLTDDLATIREHGKRADAIVRSMLLHSRGDTGSRQATDFNALIEECLNLAYHGQRAMVPGFNVTLERDLDPELGNFELVSQEISRVFVNLLGNAFYAVHQRQLAQGGDYRPTVAVCTRRLSDDRGQVRVRDNGTGIAAQALDQLFTPFFTTKPAGEGTGLGLSISHDIIVEQHGGSIRAESEEGTYTEFIIELPRNMASAESPRTRST